jgi:hypothetical protein
MKRMFFVFGNSLICIVLLCGCVSTLCVEKASQAVPTKVDSFSFDLSTPGTDAGKVVVECRPPSNQVSVAKYAIVVDSHSPLVVSKYSNTEITLNAGKHSLKLYVPPRNAAKSEKVAFGKPTTKDIVVMKDTGQTLKYTGPYGFFGKGSVEVKE